MNDPVIVNHRRGPYEDLRLMIGRMDGKLDIVLHMAQDHSKRLTDLEVAVEPIKGLPPRVTALETGQNRWLGWTVAGAVSGGGGAAALINLLTQ